MPRWCPLWASPLALGACRGTDPLPTPKGRCQKAKYPPNYVLRHHMTHISPDLLTALNRIATALETLALASGHKPPTTEDWGLTSPAYPSTARMLAVAMRDDGRSWNAIRKELVRVCGRAPSITNLPVLLPKWRKAEGREG